LFTYSLYRYNAGDYGATLLFNSNEEENPGNHDEMLMGKAFALIVQRSIITNDSVGGGSKLLLCTIYKDVIFNSFIHFCMDL